MSTRRSFGNNRIVYSDIVGFVQQLAFMIDAGITLPKALATLDDQEDKAAVKDMIGSIRKKIESGLSFSESCESFKEVLGTYFISMIVAGEQGAGLTNVLQRIAIHLEKQNSLRKKVKQLFTYPLVVGGFCLVIVTFLMLFVVPTFARVYLKMGAILPLPTRILIFLSTFLINFWHVLFASIALIVWGLSRKKAIKIRKKLINFLIERTPMLKDVNRKVSVTGFIRTFSSMLVCHISVLDALTVSNLVVSSMVVRSSIAMVRQDITEGKNLTDAMTHANIFSPVILQMIRVGEESGNVGNLLEKSADAMEFELDEIVKKTMLIVEPVFTIGIATIVGFIALAIYLPMFDMMGHVQ